MNNIGTVIIQAGGLGSKLEKYTKNKPKCLVPLNGKPLIEYSIERFKDCKIIIIGDYKFDVLKLYIENFYSKYNISLVKATGKNTCSGIQDAIKLIENDLPVCLIWSDLILEQDIEHKEEIQVFLSDAFPCRYKLEEKNIVKETTDTNGIIGLFTFKNKSVINTVPESGSFVGKWLKEQNQITSTKINNIKEIGILSALEKHKNKSFCRFFNSVEIKEDKIYKKCINNQFDNLHKDEKNWYKYIVEKKYSNIPQIYSYEPLILEYINGFHCHKLSLNEEQKITVLFNFCKAIKNLHDLENVSANQKDVDEVYYNKTFERVKKVQNIIPFFKYEELIVNNKIIKNPFHNKNINKFSQDIKNIKVESFDSIHGDCTFSNFLVNSELSVKLIDPRGCFGSTKIFGDKDYDWAKFYYSLVGNYDSINDKNYDLEFEKNIITYSLKSNGWENLETIFFELTGIDRSKNYLLNSLIWLSLCGYVIEDYDAVLIAFIKGAELWNMI
jgi:GTP:adenosylcobinamide-phosphate guanylyltransferase